MKKYYTYYSYEEWGRGYIGSRPSGCECNPEEDLYMGSFKDKTFTPTNKIILGVYSTPQECLDAEVTLHEFFKVDINPHFANLARQTSTGFISLVKTKEHCKRISKAHTGKKLSPQSIAKRQATRGPYAKGRDSKRHGIPHTPEARAKIKAARARQTNVTGGCSHPWWVKEDGTRTRSSECPGEEWRRGMIWRRVKP
jgi:hypothetical protein